MTTQPAPSGSPARHGSALRRALTQPGFIVAAGVLLVAAVGLNAATEAMQLHFKKAPVPLAHRLDDAQYGIASTIGTWVQVSKDEPLDPSMQEELGTDQFVFRDYVNTKVVSHERVDAFADKTTPERAALLGAIQREFPQAVVRLAVTYYTGKADTVPHIPERCMVADGYEPVNPQTITHPADTYADGKARQVAYRFTRFEDQSEMRRVSRNVAYCFHVNGHYESDPLGVRRTLQNLFERHGYFAKLELMNCAESADQSIEAMNDFLDAALPEIEKCLPDWNKVKAGNIPAGPTTDVEKPATATATAAAAAATTN